MRKALLFSIAITSIVGCSKNSSTAISSNSEIVGKWQQTSFIPLNHLFQPCYSGYIQFNSDNSLVDYTTCNTTSVGYKKGSYTLVNGVLTVIGDVVPLPLNYNVITLNSTTMVLTQNFDTLYTAVYKKIP